MEEDKTKELSLFKDDNALVADDGVSKKLSSLNVNDLDDYRRSLLREYRRKHKGILDKVKDGQAQTSDDMMNLIVEDLLEESEIFYGNSLVFTEEGNLRDATAISLKRTDLLKMIADIIAKKRELNQKDADIDLNSPAFMIFQKMCFDKMMEVLKEVNVEDELIRIILNKWSGKMRNWDKELKRALLDLRS